MSLTTKMRIYSSLVLSVLLYCGETWTLLDNDLARLEVFRMNCLRNIIRVSRRQRLRNKEILLKCKTTPIEMILKKRRLKWFGHTCRMNTDRIPKKLLLQDRPPNLRCHISAPRKTWVSQVLADVKPLHFRTLPEIVEAAQNRSQWRGLIRDAMEAATSGSGTLPYRR